MSGLPRGHLDALASKYMRMLGATGSLPSFRIVDNLGSRWLARCSWKSTSPTSLIEVQKSVLHDEGTLERVVAHELVHHAEFMGVKEGRRPALLVKIDGHGSFFRDGAAIVNERMGPGYVTEKSDQSYVQAPNTKKFFVLVEPVVYSGRPQLGWAWAARLSPEMRTVVRQKAAERGAKLLVATDGRWTKGVKIKRFGGLSIPRGDDDGELLAALFAGGEVVAP